VIDGKVKNVLSAGVLARHVGVSTDTLRHYESKGVIPRPPRQSNGYRIYPAGTLERVYLIRGALTIGFTLDELAGILKTRDRGGAPCRKVRELAARKLETIEERLRELVALRNELRLTLKDWDVRLAKTPADRRCGLLESLRLSASMRSPRRTPFTVKQPKRNRRRTKNS
jgi:DNA-binding transcriptional MerR regulator